MCQHPLRNSWRSGSGSGGLNRQNAKIAKPDRTWQGSGSLSHRFVGRTDPNLQTCGLGVLAVPALRFGDFGALAVPPPVRPAEFVGSLRMGWDWDVGSGLVPLRLGVLGALAVNILRRLDDYSCSRPPRLRVARRPRWRRAGCLTRGAASIQRQRSLAAARTGARLEMRRGWRGIR